MRMIKIRIRETGQVTDMVPDVARAMINGGTAEEVISGQGSGASKNESMAVAPTAERAVAPAQSPSRKPLFSRKRAG
jgi:hypothetical protein